MLFTFIALVIGNKLPCDYLRMEAGNIVVDGTAICLGPCPTNVGSSGIYIASDKKLYFNNFILQTTDENLIISRSGSQLLNCNNQSCFQGIQPQTILPAGFYLTGQSGGMPVDGFDPWTPLSTVNLEEGFLQHVVLTGVPNIRGWRVIVSGVSYAFTSSKQLIVGSVSASTILANSGQRVIADGPVLVRAGQKGCNGGLIKRPALPSITLFYFPSSTFPNFTRDARSFTMIVPLNKCVELAVPTMANFLLADSIGITLYKDWTCQQVSAIYKKYSTNGPWYGVLLYAPNYGT